MSTGHTSVLAVGSADGPLIASIDPRLRLAASVAFLLTLPLIDHAPALAAALMVGGAAVVVAGLRPATVLRRLAIAEGFLLVLLVTLPFSLPGRPIFSLFGLQATWEGLTHAVVLVLRINAGVLVTLALMGGMGSAGLARAMTGLGLPAKLGQILQMTVRYVTVFEEEYHRLRRAMRSRGFRAGSNRHSWRSLGYLIGMIFLRSFERAERVHCAMVCRGYTGQIPADDPHPLTLRDLTFAMLALATVTALLLLEAGHAGG